MSPPERFALRYPRALAQALAAALHVDPARRLTALQLRAALGEADEELREDDRPDDAAATTSLATQATPSPERP